MWATLTKHAPIALEVVRLLHTRFNPEHLDRERRKEREAEVAAAIETALQEVASLDEDRILRHFVNVVQAAIRTNFYQLDADGRPKSLIAVKFASRRLDGLP